MSNDESHRSVRVELEAGQSSTTDAPLVEGSTSTPRGPMIAGLAALVLLVVAFLALRPASDQAADGTQRLTPTTTTTTVALTSGPESATSPPTTASVTFISPDGIPTPEVESELSLALEVAELGNPIEPAAIDVSDTLQPPDVGSAEITPLALAGTSVIKLEQQPDLALEDILRFDDVIFEGSTVTGICGSYGGSPEVTTISECAEFSIVNDPVTADEPASVGTGAQDLNNSGPAFGECVALAPEFKTPGFTISDIQVGGPEQGQGTSSFDFALNGIPLEVLALSDNRVAVIDAGTVGLNASCDASGGPFRRVPGVVLLDFATGESTTFVAPPIVQTSISSGAAVEILGELIVDEFRSHLFVDFNGSLWSIDTRIGRWTALISPTRNDIDPSQSGLVLSNLIEPGFALSDSGSRLYQVNANQLVVVDLSVETTGSLNFRATNYPLVVTGLFSPGFISAATDDLIFFSNTLNTWRLTVPG